MRTIQLLYFAQLSAQAGRSEESIETDAATVGELYTSRATQYNWSLPLERVRFARNDEFCSADEPFNAGDVIAIMPPMSGG